VPPFFGNGNGNGEATDLILQRPRFRARISFPTSVRPKPPTRPILTRSETMILDEEVQGRPNDQRGFIHKKILRGISKVAGIIPIPAAQVISRVTGSFGRTAVPRTQLARGITLTSEAEKRSLTQAKFSEIPGVNLIPCRDPALVRASDGHCVAPGSPHHRQHFGGVEGGFVQPVGDAVMGRYGAGLTPGSMIIDRAVCLKGMQLGDDGLCYNKSQISNKQRMWPAGRKPLLSGGDMRAISIAARAGRRLEGATKRLQRLGMMKKPTRPRAAHRHAIAAPNVVSV